MRRLGTFAALAALTLLTTMALGQAKGTAAQSANTTTYQITIENLTTGQPMSPPVVAAHGAGAGLFSVGSAASEDIREIAENGNAAPAGATLLAAGADDVVVLGGPILPGGSATVFLTAPAGSQLSVATMLICTNDAFTGVDSVALSDGASYEGNAYDAGTEDNSELTADIVDPCGGAGPVAHDPDGNERPATTGGTIAAHPGIAGTGDLDPAQHGWTDPVIRISVAQVATVKHTVTVTNLTSGQPFSPPLVAAHSADTSVFTTGEAASEGVRTIAEDGDMSVLNAALSGLGSVHNVVTFGGPILPGTSASVTIEAPADAVLSVVTMLICTNDAFTGVAGLPLAAAGMQMVEKVAYDAGTEENSELTADIVDPCGGAGPVKHDPDGNERPASSGGVITAHAGIQGTGDLDPAQHGWTGNVAKIAVQSGPAPAAPPAGNAGLAPDSGSSTPWLWIALGLAALALAGSGSVYARRSLRS